MNYLEEEIDEAIYSLNITSRKLDATGLVSLLLVLTKTFFKLENCVLNPINLRDKSTEYNPKFWQEIQHRIHQKRLIFLVYDSAYRAWKFDDAQDVASILGETTGYPFWVMNSDFTLLVHMDDHDCVTWAKK